jgi:hypothetical protein
MLQQSVIFAARTEWQEDNRAMTEDRDLLPWILGGVSMAAIAMAIAVGLNDRSTPAHVSGQFTPTMPDLATAQLSPKTSTTSAPAIAASNGPVIAAPATITSSPAPNLGAPQTQTAPTPPGSQIWECTTNGVKTFSNNRCGSAAILRDVGPINVMDASPVASNVHWYGPDSNDTPDYYYPDASQPAGNSYPVVVGIPYLERRRPEHPHQPNNQNRGTLRHN